jgi:hypothetical protein
MESNQPVLELQVRNQDLIAENLKMEDKVKDRVLLKDLWMNQMTIHTRLQPN